MDLIVFVPPAIAFAFFLTIGIVCWSYRDVYHRHSDKTAGADHGSHDAGHGAHH